MIHDIKIEVFKKTKESRDTGEILENILLSKYLRKTFDREKNRMRILTLRGLYVQIFFVNEFLIFYVGVACIRPQTALLL